MKVLSSDQADDMGKRSGETSQGAPASDGRVGVPRSPVPRKAAKRGREAQAMMKLGRTRIIKRSSAEMGVAQDILGHGKKGGVMGEWPFPEITHPQQRAFLAAFRETGNVRLACEVAKVGRSSHHRWLKEDPEYRKAVELAKEDATDQGRASSHGQVTSRRKDQRMKPQRYQPDGGPYDVTIQRNPAP